ncbi:uncharacterized protein ACR2FA_006058 isoform 2-T2 [Aphomia sociella]
MAPRSAKTKKTEVNAENDAPKQGRNKGKAVVDPMPDDIDINEKSAPVTEKKTKRAKRKAANDSNEQDQINDVNEEIAPPSKKGKKVAESTSTDEKSVSDTNGFVEDETVSLDGNHQNGDVETNGETEQTKTAATGRGRKKPTKKELATEKSSETKPKETGRSRKNVKQEKAASEEIDEPEVKEKPVAKKKGRKAQSKPEDQPNTEENIETIQADVKSDDPPAKGRKRGPKAIKEKSPESEKEESQKEKSIEATKKKETKGKKTQGKKAQSKDNIKEEEEEEEEDSAPKQKKGAKKEGKGDAKDDVTEEDGEIEAKPAKGKRGAKNKIAETTPSVEEEPEDTGEPKQKKRAVADDTKKKAPPKNKATTDYSTLDFTNTSKNAQGKEWNYKISSWNVDGIRAWLSKGGLDYIQHEKPDILCLQEVKCSQDKLPIEVTNLPGYHAYWLCSDKDGYAGVGIYTTKLAMNVTYGLQNEELDSEGRIITAEYEHFYLICTYVPNAGRNLVTLPKRLQWNEEFRKYVNELDKKKPVIICGDMNVAHNEIDLANPKTNKKNAGFTPEERAGMTDLLGDGFVDTYRHLYPDKTGAYTFWTYMMNSRSKNVGWRLDYFIVPQRFLPSVCDNVIRDGVYGSDHCPISLFLHLSSAEKPK